MKEQSKRKRQGSRDQQLERREEEHKVVIKRSSQSLTDIVKRKGVQDLEWRER